MNLKLKRPICFFDLETTGTDVVNDRIVEVGALKKLQNGDILRKRWLLNPTIPIPKEASDVHGITDEMVAQAPTFKEKAKEIHAFMGDSDLAGFNSNKFDIPVLAEEFERAGVEFNMEKRMAVDVQNIFHKMEPRTLTAAVKFYCGKELEDAHSAVADAEATLEVFEAQLLRYSKEFEALAENEKLPLGIELMSKISNRGNALDFAGYIRLNDAGKAIFSFGKYKGAEVQGVLNSDPGYFNWIQNADFPLYTKRVLIRLKLENAFKK